MNVLDILLLILGIAALVVFFAAQAAIVDAALIPLGQWRTRGQKRWLWIIGMVLVAPIGIVYFAWLRPSLKRSPDNGERILRESNFFLRVGRMLLAPALAAVVAIEVSSIVLQVSGHNPREAFSEMWKILHSTQSVVGIINAATPLYVAGVAVAVGFKMNLFNIGVNGQYTLAALIAAWAGAEVDLPAPLHIAFILLIAIVVGAAWAGVAGVLKVTRNVNEVISTIMLNYVAVGIIAYLLSEHFRNPDATISETHPLPASGQLPSLDGIFGFTLGRDGLNGFLPFAIAIGVGFYILLYRSRFGFELRVSGMNPSAATSAGVKPKAMILKTMLLSGAIAGLIGMGPLLADDDFHKYGDQFPGQLGLTGIAIALLGRNHPVGIAAGAIVWATIGRATQPLSSQLGIPQEVGDILLGTFLLAAVVVYEIIRRRNDVRTAKDAADRAARAHSEAPGGPPGALATAGMPS